MKKYTNKKNIMRATFMTILFVVYLTLFKNYIGYSSITSLVILIVSCFILDFVLVRVMKSKYLRRYFYEVIEE